MFLAAAAFATGAAAEDAPGPIEQYVEQVPTAEGKRAVVGKGGTISKPLPPSVKKKLGVAGKGDGSSTGEQRDAEDQLLPLVAGSPNYGATTGGVNAKPGTRDGAKGSPGEDGRAPGSDDADDASASAVSSRSDDADAFGTARIAAIVAILLAIAASALVAARWRGRARA